MDEKEQTILKLIVDEIEAIDGYKEALNKFKDQEIIDKLTEIMEEEKVHKKELRELLWKI